MVYLAGVLCGRGMLKEKKKEESVIAGDHREKKIKCKLLVSLQRQLPALQPSPVSLQQSLAQGNSIMPLDGAGGLKFLDVASVWFCESYNFLTAFKKPEYILQFSHQLKQLLEDVGGSKGMDDAGSGLCLPRTLGLFPAGLAHPEKD